MLIGDRNEFAIEAELVVTVGTWALGRFVFWLDRHLVGDSTDEAVDLKGCMGWLQDFVENQRNRYEPGLYRWPKELVFRRLCAGVLDAAAPGDGDKELYQNSFSRFHVSHLGMSSFDHVTILLVTDKVGRQRCIWQSGEEPVREAYLPPGRMEEVASRCIERFLPLIAGG